MLIMVFPIDKLPLFKDIHEVNISYKTVENYCKAASSIVNPVLEFYPY